jgi:hypothetical protein
MILIFLLGNIKMIKSQEEESIFGVMDPYMMGALLMT